MRLSFIILLIGLLAGNSCSSQQSATEIKSISAIEAQELLQDTEAILLDVRTPEEISNGKIENALEIDFRSKDFVEKIQKLNPEKTYIVYCASGNRSSQASKLMIDHGFQHINNLLGGYRSWPDKKK